MSRDFNILLTDKIKITAPMNIDETPTFSEKNFCPNNSNSVFPELFNETSQIPNPEIIKAKKQMTIPKINVDL